MSERKKTLTINEIYHSIQGESTWVGRPCVFVRLTFCNLRCNYCDTEYAFYEGKKRTLDEILEAVATFGCPLVEITGGEPLLQKNVLPLMTMLCDSGYTVLLETSGAHGISRESAALRSGIALPCGALFTDLWPDRSAPDCGMDSGRQTQRAVSTSDAQIHLEPSATWCLKDVRKLRGELPRTQFTVWQCRSSAVYYIARRIMR